MKKSPTGSRAPAGRRTHEGAKKRAVVRGIKKNEKDRSSPLLTGGTPRGTKGTTDGGCLARDEEGATGDGAEKRERQARTDWRVGRREKKENPAVNHLAFARPCRMDGRERTRMDVCVRICAGTCVTDIGNLPEVHLVVKRPQEGGGG